MIFPNPSQGKPNAAVNLGEEIQRLRGEVRSLRADVQTIIKLLQERNDATKDARHSDNRVRSTDVSNQPRPAKSPPKPAINQLFPVNRQTKSDKTQQWSLTLPEVMSIAQQNSPKNVRYLLKDAFDKSEKGNAVQDAFRRLQMARMQLTSAKVQRAEQAGKFAFSVTLGDELYQIPTFSHKHDLAALRNAELNAAMYEAELRKLLGLAGSDGRAIMPVGQTEQPSK
jgi:hypothetical protein